MPAINPGAGTSNGPQQQQRATFRPPWVKDGPEPLPMPTAPWTLARARQRGSIGSEQEPAFVKPNLKPVPRKNSTTTPNNVAENSSGPSGAAKNEPAPIRKTSKITIIPSRPSVDGEIPKENGHDAGVSSRTQPEAKPKSQAREIPIQITSTTKPKQEETRTKIANKQQEEPSKSVSKLEEPKKTAVKPEEPRKTSVSKPEEPRKTSVSKPEEPRKTSVSKPEEPRKISVSKPEEPRKTSVSKPEPEEQRRSSIKNDTIGPPKPPAPPMPPPPPPMGDKKPVTAEKAEKLEALRSRPRKRPDWGALMKAVEGGNRKLKHVQCNDRSTPLIPKAKIKGSFLYESEKPNAQNQLHNQLLKEIQSGVKLKRVQTNDRSKPLLHGLRKFRRQMTIEEQIQKAETEEVVVEPDELDDIDKVRDDLQSTKQMLALELRNKEAVERENKKLLTRILNLEVELEKERANKRITEEQSPQAKKEEDEQEKKKLKEELEEAQKVADEMETKYHDSAGQLEMARSDIEELQRKNQILERKLQASILNQERDGEQSLRKQPSSKKLASAKASTADVKQVMNQQPKQDEEEEESEYEEVTETETESSDEEEDAAVLQERRTARELKLLVTKLKSFKEKEEAARKERRALREQLKKQQKILREEKKKYKHLQKEVDSVANMMKDDEEEEEEVEEEEETEESESESESEESEEEQSDGDLPPDAPAEKRKANLSERGKRHENCLGALRKGNYLLKANIDRLKDDLFKQKEMSLALQEDLNSVLAELG